MPTQQELMIEALRRSGQPLPTPFDMGAGGLAPTPVNPYGGGSYGGSSPFNMAPAPSAPSASPNATFAGEEAGINAQQRMAEALMAQSQKSPDLITAGRVSHAGANPMTALAQGIQGYYGGKGAADVQKRSAGLSAREDAAAAAQDEIDAAALETEAALEKTKRAMEERKQDEVELSNKLDRESREEIARQNRAAADARADRVAANKPTIADKADLKEKAKLEETRTPRIEGIDKATKFLSAFNSGAQSGVDRTAAGFIPGAHTDQGRFDEELDAFAEQAARARLKALGEIRPTDVDVEGMKAALFGKGRDENTNRNLLTEYISEQIAEENRYRELDGLEPLPMPEGKVVEGEDWYKAIFKQNLPNGQAEVVTETEKKVVRRGKLPDGRTIIQYSDGSEEIQ